MDNKYVQQFKKGSLEMILLSYYNKVVSTPTFGRDKNDLEGEGA